MENPNYFLIDALNLAHRSHNVNFELRTASGIYSGMLFGFLRTLVSLKKKYQGYKFVVVWDNRAERKYQIQPDYKSGRSRFPDVVSSQIPDIRNFLKHCGVDQYEMKGEEADDVIASLIEMFRDKSRTILVYSNDKDLLQLVEDGKVIVYRPKVGLSPEKFYDEEAVRDQFGVPPSKLPCYRSFDGDSSDSISGVSRVPRKIIAGLVNKCSSIESVYSALVEEKLTEFQRKSFEEARDRVLKNYQIIALNRSLNGICCEASNIDAEKMSEILSRYEIRSINPDVVSELFSSSLNVRYTEPRPHYTVESMSLFD